MTNVSQLNFENVPWLNFDNAPLLHFATVPVLNFAMVSLLNFAIVYLLNFAMVSLLNFARVSQLVRKYASQLICDEVSLLVWDEVSQTKCHINCDNIVTWSQCQHERDHMGTSKFVDFFKHFFLTKYRRSATNTNSIHYTNHLLTLLNSFNFNPRLINIEI